MKPESLPVNISRGTPKPIEPKESLVTDQNTIEQETQKEQEKITAYNVLIAKNKITFSEFGKLEKFILSTDDEADFTNRRIAVVTVIDMLQEAAYTIQSDHLRNEHIKAISTKYSNRNKEAIINYINELLDKDLSISTSIIKLAEFPKKYNSYDTPFISDLKQEISQLKYQTYTFTDGRTYTGKLINENFAGQGILIYHNDGSFTKYIGNFKNGKYHGQGSLICSDGRTYIGEFKDGNPVGRFSDYPDHSIDHIGNLTIKSI